MPSLKFIKRRILGVRTTRQVMKAMNMVAASKLQKSRTRLYAVKPFVTEARRITDNLKYSEEAKENIFIKPRKINNTVYIVITGDRGLCGSYNANVSQKAFSHMNENGKTEKIIVIGNKGVEYFRRRGKNILRTYTGTAESAYYENSANIADLLLSLYKSGETDEVYLVYTKFNSVMSYTPHIERLLPVSIESDTAHNDFYMMYEPDVNTFLEYTVPTYMAAFIYGALVESTACEQAARMVSMDSATNNATEIINKSIRMYNRKRQAVITQEISEIINGVNMMN